MSVGAGRGGSGYAAADFLAGAVVRGSPEVFHLYAEGAEMSNHRVLQNLPERIGSGHDFQRPIGNFDGSGHDRGGGGEFDVVVLEAGRFEREKMKALQCEVSPSSLRIHGVRCCSVAPDKRTPKILKFAVSGVTELLRLFSSSSAARDRLDAVSSRPKEEISVSGVDDVVMVLKSDYENAYFVTGIFTSSLYAEDCIFEDPTIRFQGTELYARNLRLLVPFFDQPSIGLQDIKKVLLISNVAFWRKQDFGRRFSGSSPSSSLPISISM